LACSESSNVVLQKNPRAQQMTAQIIQFPQAEKIVPAIDPFQAAFAQYLIFLAICGLFAIMVADGFGPKGR
jgi:hypothetical protein